jgi:hypothetical protein
MKYDCKSVIIGRMPRANKEDEFKTAFFKLFRTTVDPLVGGAFPDEELTFANIESVHINCSQLDFYPEGNDMVIRHISSAEFVVQGEKLTVTLIK